MKKIFLLLIALFVISSCVPTSTGVTSGLFYNDWKDRDLTNEGLIDNSVTVTKKGEACLTNILGVAFGDSSLRTAKKNGKLTKVTHVDRTYKSVLSVYQKGCTIALGR